tara:strand:- start:139 stop:312 length:174 start_codon:yes stop_codon:yes gene_type:complete
MNNLLFVILVISIIALLFSVSGFWVIASIHSDLDVVWSELAILKDASITLLQEDQCY